MSHLFPKLGGKKRRIRERNNMTIANRAHRAARMLENVKRDVQRDSQCLTLPVVDALADVTNAAWALVPIIREHEQRERALTKRKGCSKRKSNE